LNKRYGQQQQGKEKDALLNEEIVANEVRCMTDGGDQLGIIPLKEALSKANQAGLDLVLIAATAKPPVCKIMDYGKFRYQQEKKKKEAKKKQKIIDVKEIKLSVKIAQNDINYKVKHAREFLEAEKHVKFRVFLRGREMSDPQAGVRVLNGVWDMVKDLGDMDKNPKQEGRYINMMVIPKNSVKR